MYKGVRVIASKGRVEGRRNNCKMTKEEFYQFIDVLTYGIGETGKNTAAHSVHVVESEKQYVAKAATTPKE